jgi:hypothetical protein
VAVLARHASHVLVSDYEARIAAAADLMDRLPVVEHVWRDGTITAHLTQISEDGGISSWALCGKRLAGMRVVGYTRSGRLRWAEYHEERPEFHSRYIRSPGAQCCTCRSATVKAAKHVERLTKKSAWAPS